MIVKIKPIVNPVGNEELVVIPISRDRDYLLCLNFFEDVPNGRLARLVVVLDRYNEVNDIVRIVGKKAFVDSEGIDEAYEILNRILPIERRAPSYVIPLYFDIKVYQVSLSESSGVRGYFNYIRKNGKIDLQKLKNVIPFSIYEMI